MNIHEYQAKKILSEYGIKIPKGGIAYTPTEAKKVALKASARGPWMLKAQIQSGARNLGYFIEKTAGSEGGIRRIDYRRDIRSQAEQMLGATLVTIQTGPQGKFVGRLYVEAYLDVVKKFYLGLAVDRVKASLTLLAALVENDDITNMAINSPDSILRVPLDLDGETTPEQVRQVSKFLKLSAKAASNLGTLINGMHRAFLEQEATMIEINPVGVLRSGELMALDAKISFDDNALYRHADVLRLKDDYEASERELQAAKDKFTYSEFEGSVGCVANGNDAAMATMDMLRQKGVGTACFLNVKGGVDKDKIASGIKIIMTNPRVEGILINILGGFLRCNLIAEGIVSVASDVGLNVPLVVRFEGTNKDEAKDILQKSKLPVIMAETTEEAATLLVKAMEDND